MGNSSFLELAKDKLSQVLKPEDLKEVQITACGTNCLQLSSDTSLIFQMEMGEDISSPEVSTSQQHKILKLPSEEFFKDPSSKDLLRYWLIGHEFHPYSESPGKSPGESPGKILLKPAQREAIEAYEQAVDMGARSFLHVAPTAVGKTLVLTKALFQRLKNPSAKKLIIVTAHEIHLVDQLLKEIQTELAEENDLSGVELINWRDQKHRDLNKAIVSALSNEGLSVFVMTSQSLKKQLAVLEPENYEKLVLNLEGIFIDEVHHLGASQTKSLIYGLFENSPGFLYGTTATPVHHALSLSALFERVHWSYLSEGGDLFKEYLPGSVLKQLSLGIERGDLTSFDDLFIIGEPAFKEEQSVFAVEKGLSVLNSVHYKRLAEILSPLLFANQKGFIVTATIKESERLADFLNGIFPEIQFAAYHSQLSLEDRLEILRRSKEDEGSYYIVAVRALDEGVNMPWLSAYIDLNANISVKQMIHRVGRVLRLYTGKQQADILFLTDYRSAEMAKDLLELLDSVKSVSFKRGVKSGEMGSNGELDSVSPAAYIQGGISNFVRGEEIFAVTREELMASRELLEESARSFWNKDDKSFLSYEDLQKIVQEAGVRTIKEYQNYRKKHPELNLPFDPNLVYKDRWTGWGDFLGTGYKVRKNFLSYEDAQSIMQEAGVKTSEEYKIYRKKHPELNLPSDPPVVYKDHWTDWGDFLGTGYKHSKNFVSYEEAQSIVQEAEVRTAEEYKIYRKKHPELNLPFNPPVVYKDKWTDWGDFLGTGNKHSKNFLSYEDLQEIVRKAGVGTRREYKNYRKKHPKLNLPANPHVVYKDRWTGWGDFLGTGYNFLTGNANYRQDVGGNY